MTETPPRLHPFDTIRNFRDFGGYESRYGGRVRMGRLFRSGHYGEASDGDIAALGRFNIQLQADLRRPDEREKQAGRWSAPVTLTHDGGREHEAPHTRFLKEVAVDADAADQWMVEYYEAAPFKAHHMALFRDWMAGIASLPDDAAGLVNCAAGKDRTGILCALTHHVLGVSEEDIRADYDLTNVAVEVDKRLPEAAAYFNAMIGKSHDLEVFRPFMGVRLHYLEAAFASIEARAGSVGVYVTEALGIDAATQDAIRARLIEP